MKPQNHCFLFLFSILLLFDINAQKNDTIPSPNDSIKSDANFAESMSLDEFYTFMRPYPEAFKYAEFAKESNVFTKIFSYAAGIPLGYALGHFFFTSDFLWEPVAIGGGLLGMALLFDIRTNNQIQKAVNAYNLRNDNASLKREGVKIGLGFTHQGVGFVLSF